MAAIFISNSSTDISAAAEMKAARLETKGRNSLFVDFDPEIGIKSGASWKLTLYQKLRQSQAVISLLIPNWLASK